MQPFPGRGRFLLLRHGETDWNRERRVMGRRAVPLNERGRDQIRALKPLLDGVAIHGVWTSPVVRARASAELFAEISGGVPIHDEVGLTEVEFGEWTGRTFESLLADPAYHEFQRAPLTTRLPGGGESIVDVQQRVFTAMARVAEQAHGAPVAVVSHGDPLRLILCGCLGVDLAHFRRLRVENGALSAIELTGSSVEVKFVNLRPDVSSILESPRDGARDAREERRAIPAQDEGPSPKPGMRVTEA